jgi:hypothetical protein
MLSATIKVVRTQNVLCKALNLSQEKRISFYNPLVRDEDRTESLNREHVFSSDRTRDHYSSLNMTWVQDKTTERIISQNNEVESYDCHGTISLSATMQSNVPEPFKVCGQASAIHHYDDMPRNSSESVIKHTSSHRVDLVQS